MSFDFGGHTLRQAGGGLISSLWDLSAFGKAGSSATDETAPFAASVPPFAAKLLPASLVLSVPTDSSGICALISVSELAVHPGYSTVLLSVLYCKQY